MYIGIDVGGTNLVAGVVNEENQIVARAKVKTADCRDADHMIRELVRISKEAVAAAGLRPEDIQYVGAGIPGAVHRKVPFIYHTVNAPFHGTPFGELFQKEWGSAVPVYLENDANCAALAEFVAGSGKHCKSLLMITLGTGVGGGLVVDGAVKTGINLSGMEVGHMVIESNGVPCTCGRKGCWEQYSSAPALKRMTREEMERSPDSAMWELCGGSLDKVGGRTAFQAARAGDAAAKRVTETYLHYLAEGITNLVNIFQVEEISLGGGVSNERDEDFLIPLQRLVEERRFTQEGTNQTRIIKAALGNDAGIIGAALLGRMDYIELA
jgi:glucokinase